MKRLTLTRTLRAVAAVALLAGWTLTLRPQMLGGPATYELHGAANDGKGEPTQANAVSHGCPVTRFRQINVLNTAAKKA